ncbi:MAG: anthranilate synthase component I, partial [Actinomycetes bacterium]
MIRPTPDEFALLARDHTVVPVWREVLGDLTTPVAGFARVALDERAFLLESVEHGERWGRWSFIGRHPSATLIARDGSIEVEGRLPEGVPLDRGVLAAVEAILGACRSPTLDGLPPLHGGVVGYLSYDVVREVEHLPEVPPDESGYPDAILSIVGQVVAYDSWRQRVVLVDSVAVPPGASRRQCDACYEAAVARLDELALEGTQPLDEPLIVPPER